MTVAATVLLGFDPGKDKCGVALIQQAPYSLIQHEVVSSTGAIAYLQTCLQRFSIETLVIGDQTTSKQWQQQLSRELNPTPNIVPVDERNTTLLARDRYWQMFPPQGFQRLIPQGMRQPPRPIDDIVAILLIERYLELP